MVFVRTDDHAKLFASCMIMDKDRLGGALGEKSSGVLVFLPHQRLDLLTLCRFDERSFLHQQFFFNGTHFCSSASSHTAFPPPGTRARTQPPIPYAQPPPPSLGSLEGKDRPTGWSDFLNRRDPEGEYTPPVGQAAIPVSASHSGLCCRCSRDPPPMSRPAQSGRSKRPPVPQRSVA